ncbi:hypothetical protein CHS0354_018896 [Potamilus streckersoni]|uniref:Uncharacterized protein n=1 Tax=Potamilus streckersoni TaxID=2493646 RepID=A0AAE0VU85_9BIVA|nr:hypothetical protein CHS0354_018896 [Potamilus streckersoni]
MNLLVIAWIYAASLDSSTGFFLCNPDNPVPYEEDQLCCNSTLHSVLDTQGRRRGCCSSQLFYPDNCKCEDNSKLTSLNPGYDPGLCLVTVSEQSGRDTTEMTPSSSKVPEIADFTQKKRCPNPNHIYCKNSGNCFDPSEEICCQDGVFKGIFVCPPQDLNSKFYTENECFEMTVCAKQYNYAYEVSVIEMIPLEDSSITFVARARQTMSEGFSVHQKRSWKKFIHLRINETTPYNCAITGRSFTVLTTKEHIWNAASYIYLDKDDLVISGKIRNKHLSTIYKKCNKPISGHPFEVKNVSNSGYRQYFTVLSLVTLLFASDCIAF